jgi:hypothetical protein
MILAAHKTPVDNLNNLNCVLPMPAPYRYEAQDRGGCLERSKDCFERPYDLWRTSVRSPHPNALKGFGPVPRRRCLFGPGGGKGLPGWAKLVISFTKFQGGHSSRHSPHWCRYPSRMSELARRCLMATTTTKT